MAGGEAEDADGLTPVKDDNETMRHFIRRTLSILKCVDYKRMIEAAKVRRGNMGEDL